MARARRRLIEDITSEKKKAKAQSSKRVGGTPSPSGYMLGDVT